MSLSPNAPPDPSTPVGFVVERAGVLDAWHEISHRTDDPTGLVEALASAGLATEAIRCIAVAVPSRQSIWWAWVSARHTLVGATADGAKESPRMQELLDMIEQWIAAPDATKRRAIWEVAQALGIKHPVTLCAAATWFSGGSIATAEGAAPVPAPPGMVATFVSAAVAIATLQGDPQHADERVRASIAQGLEIVTKLGGWSTAIGYVRHESGGAQQEVS
ncbi:MAG: hypothetical protein H7099_12765 [Gemmatimonadaceae bacterium]|nr:hypothetical protein [Gemmatimonadaceae bacterium]